MDRNGLRVACPCGDQSCEMDAQLGRRTHLQHDCHPSRLVYLAPTHVGGPNRHLLFHKTAANRSRTAPSSDGVVDLIRQHNADVWFENRRRTRTFRHQCEKCGSTEFTKENDILDVWFDSGSSHLAVLTEENGLRWPAELYMEGGDQYRGWFQSSLLVGVGLRSRSPFRGCATNGWALDGDGRPLSKSLGNGVAPEEIIRDYGAELIRLWTASVDFMEDVRISPEILKQLSDAYRKLRNTFRYALGNLHDFNPATDAVPGDGCLGLDQWILVRAEDVVARSRVWYDGFEFHKVYRAVYDFATVELSSIDFDVLKDRLYTSAPKSLRAAALRPPSTGSPSRWSAFSPPSSVSPREIWGHLNQPDSVHMSCFPESADLTEGIGADARARVANWTRLIEVRESVLKSLETARQEKFIGAPLEARVRLAETLGFICCSIYTRASSPACSSSPRSSCRITRARVSRLPSNAPAAQNASAAGNTRKMSDPCPGSRPSARRAPKL